MLLTDFGISYKEVSDLGKLIRTFAQKEHKIVKTSTSKNIHANVLEFWLNEIKKNKRNDEDVNIMILGNKIHIKLKGVIINDK